MKINAIWKNNYLTKNYFKEKIKLCLLKQEYKLFDNATQSALTLKTKM